jgi:hypothetical protein
MPASAQIIEVDGIRVEVVRKKVKRLRLVVYPATGRVRVSAPLRVNNYFLQAAIVERLDWIRKQQSRQQEFNYPPPLDYVEGEQHYYQGRAYCLRIHHTRSKQHCYVCDDTQVLNLHTAPTADSQQRQKIVHACYRDYLQQQIPLLIEKWQPPMQVHVAAWGIKKMHTRWGSCNIRAHRIWLNLELAKHSPQCLEYVVVHEMVHLLEPSHNARFKMLMDRFLPEWRLLKAALNGVMPVVEGL